MRKLVYSRGAVKGLRRMPRAEAESMRDRLQDIADGQAEAEKLRGRPEHKVRVGGWRALLLISDDTVEVRVVARRGQVYSKQNKGD